MNDLKVLVTGGAGFIGSNLVEFLISKGAYVVCLDNFSTGKRKNIEHHLSNPAFRLVEGDIRDLGTCMEVCADVDYVLHQAALGSVPRSINDPIQTNAVNIDGFLNMLDASRRSGIRRFVYAASSSTYGDSAELPKVEDRIGKPLSPYAITKYVNELYADVFGDLYGIETVGLRYFNVFGRRQDPDGAYAAVIPLFIKQFLNGDSPTINGDGSISRDFTYIDNVLQANWLAMTTDNKDALRQVYNVAYGQQTSLSEMARMIQEELSHFQERVSAVEIKIGEPRKGDIAHSLASIEKARSLLGYDPLFDFSAGLKACTQWYVENL